MRFVTLLITTLVLAAAQTTSGQQAPLRVLGSNGMKAVIEQLQGRLEKELGRSLAIQFNTSVAVRKSIEAGDPFDVTVLTSEVVNELAKSGKIVSNSIVDLGRSGIGFGVREGAPKPDVQTPNAVKKTLLNAKSLTWVSTGASRAHIDSMLDMLGIAADVKSKTVLTQGVDESLALVAQGKNDMIVTLTSEILPSKGVQYVAPLPDKFQSYVTFAAGVSSASSAPKAGALLIKLLGAREAATVYQAKGMELPSASNVRPRPVK